MARQSQSGQMPKESHPKTSSTSTTTNFISMGIIRISWDLYTTTGTDHHAEVTQEMFLAQLNNGHIDRRTTTQLYDPKAKRFLPDRYVEGVCPHCGYEEARGDQCDDCGKTYDAVELMSPRSKLSDAVPEPRETEHFYFKYSDFNDDLKQFLENKPVGGTTSSTSQKDG